MVWLSLSSLAWAGADDRATRLSGLELIPLEDGLLAVVQADGSIEHRVSKPQGSGNMLVVDVLGVLNPLRHYYPAEPHPLLERVLMYEYPAATNPARSGPLARIVFELKREASHAIAEVDRGLEVRFTEYGGSAVESQSEAPVASSSTPAANDPLVPSNVSIEPPDVPASLFFERVDPSRDLYRLGPEDVIEVRVFELDQLNRKVRISGDGSVELPLVGSIPARGLTAEEVAERIADRLRDRYVQDPQVSIFVVEFNSQTVSLLGAVSEPSTYSLTGRRRLLQVLAEAGSLTPEAGRTLYVFRQTPDGRSARLSVPLNELLLQGDPRWNLPLRAGDVITVPPERALAVSVLGAVASPGVHKLPVGGDATLLKAIALAGGLNDRASKKGVQIKRSGEDGEEIVLKANLGDILAGKAPDVVLLEGDVVVVRESFF